MMSKPYQLVKVKWVDSNSLNGWVHLDDIKEKEIDLEVNSVGYLIKGDEKSVTLSAHVADESFDSPMTIPKCAIRTLEELEDV